jgi:hypothetical protein
VPVAPLARSWTDLPKAVDDFDKRFAEAKKRLTRNEMGPCGPLPHLEAVLCGLEWTGMRDDPMRQLGRRLHLDGRAEVELHERLYQMGLKLNGPPAWGQKMLKQLALEYAGDGELDRSTKLYTKLAGQLTEPDAVRATADAIALNQKAAAALAKAGPQRPMVAEWLRLGSHGEGGFSRAVDDLAYAFPSSGPPTMRTWQELNRKRKFPSSERFGMSYHDTYVYLGDVPVWQLEENWYSVSTGPRPDWLRTEELRYYLADKDAKEGVDNAFIADGTPRKEVSARFEVRFTPADDWWPLQGDAYTRVGKLQEIGIDPAKLAHPAVGLLFGMKDVDVDSVDDPRGGKPLVPRPLHGYLVAIAADGVSLVELGEAERKSHTWKGVLEHDLTMSWKVLEHKAANLSGAKLAVSVEVRGGSVKATVNGQAFTFGAPRDVTGFYGLDFKGPGYASLGALKVTAH